MRYFGAPPQYLDCLQHIDQPFFTPVYDFCSPTLVFGRVARVGDASSDPGKVTSGASRSLQCRAPFRQVYLDVKGEQSIEQLCLAIRMMLAEPAARNLFGAVLE